MVTNIDYENIVTSGLTLLLDAGYIPSYPRSGTTWSDLTVNGNNGTLINGPTFSSDNVGSIVFDGGDDYVTISDSANLRPTSFSIDTWFRPTSFSQFNTVVTKPFNGPTWTPPYLSYMIRLYTNGTVLECGTNTGGTFRYFTINNTFLTNTIYNVSFTFDSSTGVAIAYLNGNTLSTTTFPAGIISYSALPVLIGASHGGIPVGEFFTGNIYSVKIYNRILPASEILQNYNQLKSRFNL